MKLISFLILCLALDLSFSSRDDKDSFRNGLEDHDDHWLRITVDELVSRGLVYDYPENIRPIKKEYVNFEASFLKLVNWIYNKTDWGNDMSIRTWYYFLNETDLNKPIKLTVGRRKSQVFFYDTVMENRNSRFMKEIMKNKDNEHGSKTIRVDQFFEPIKIQSHVIHGLGYVFNARMFYNDVDEITYYTHDDLGAFELLNYNELYREIGHLTIHVSRVLLDYHWLRRNETSCMQYDKKTERTLKELKEEDRIDYYLDYYNYTLHIGRFERFVENAWLMFLKIRDYKTGKYYAPYRVISPNNYRQNEEHFYYVQKNKFKNYFRLDANDNAYEAIFEKVENEEENAEGVWMSDMLLTYLKFLNPTDVDLENFKMNNNNLTYEKMVHKMCTFDPSSPTRMVTLHITQDYNFFLEKKPLYQLSFSSDQILRWTCYPLKEKDCLDKTFSIVCRYLKKNYQDDKRKTEKTDKWPLPWLVQDRTPDPTVRPPLEERPNRVTENGSAIYDYYRDSFPNSYFKYSSANELKSCMKILFSISTIFLFVKFLVIS